MKCVAQQSAQHDNFALGEIKNLDGRENGMIAQGDKRIDGPDRHTADGQLYCCFENVPSPLKRANLHHQVC